jgi:hypothetical protein
MSDLLGTDLEQIMRHKAKLAAEALKPTVKLCKAAEKAAHAYHRALPVPYRDNALTYASTGAQNSAIRVADAHRTYEWIAAGCPQPGGSK